MNAVNDTFFSLPTETKAKYARDFAATGNSHGWIGIGKERSVCCGHSIIALVVKVTQHAA